MRNRQAILGRVTAPVHTAERARRGQLSMREGRDQWPHWRLAGAPLRQRGNRMASGQAETDGALSCVAADKSWMEVTAAAHNPGAGNFAVQFWLQVNSTAVAYHVLERGANSTTDKGWRFYLSSGALRWSISDGATRVDVALGTVTTGSHHITANFDRAFGQLEVIVDGDTAFPFTADISTVTGALDLTRALHVGKFGVSSPIYLDGKIESLGICIGSLLTDADVTWLYNSGKGRTSADLSGPILDKFTSWWNFQQTAFTTAYDAIGSHHLTFGSEAIIDSTTRNGGFEDVTHGANRITGDSANFDGGTVGNWVAAGGAAVSHKKANELLWTDAFDNAVWAGTATVTANAASDPDGATTADYVEQTATNQNKNQGATPGGDLVGRTFTYSIWLRADAAQNALIKLQNGGSGSDSIEAVVSLTTSWQRFSITRTFATSGTEARVILWPSEWDGPLQGVYTWRANLREGTDDGTDTKVEGTATTVGGLGVEMVANAESGISLPTASGMTPEGSKLYRPRFRYRLLKGTADTLTIGNSADGLQFRDTGSDQITPTAAWQDYEGQFFCTSAGDLQVLQPDTGSGATYEFDDFELQEITLGDWTWSVSGSRAVFVTDDADTGVHALILRSDGSASWADVRQSNALTLAKSYHVAIRAKGVGQVATDSFDPEEYVSGPLTSTYANGSAEGLVDWSTLALKRTGANQEIYLDNITLKATNALGTTGITAGKAVARAPGEGDSVSILRDRSGNLLEFEQATPTRRMELVKDANGVEWLLGDMIDDKMGATIPAWLSRLNDWTLELAIQTGSDVSTGQQVLDAVQSATDRIGIRIQSGEIRVGTYDGTTWTTAKSGTVAADTKYIVMVSLSDGVLTLRLNGVDQTGINTPAASGVVGLTLGNYSSTTDNAFAGRIAREGVFGYSRALSDTQISRLEYHLNRHLQLGLTL